MLYTGIRELLTFYLVAVAISGCLVSSDSAPANVPSKPIVRSESTVLTTAIEGKTDPNMPLPPTALHDRPSATPPRLPSLQERKQLESNAENAPSLSTPQIPDYPTERAPEELVAHTRVTKQPTPVMPLSRDVKTGKNAYGVEQISCEGASGAWVLLYEGEVVELRDDLIDMRIFKRYGVRYWPAAEGIDATDWYCVPRRRYCYSEVGFGDWGSKLRKADTYAAPRDHVFPIHLRLPMGLNPIIKQQCGS